MTEELEKRIEAVLDEKVRPELSAHQGDVQVMDFTYGVLRVRLTGKCSGCPSAALTTETLIAQEIRAQIPEVTEVILWNGVSEDLMQQARNMLSQRHQQP